MRVVGTNEHPNLENMEAEVKTLPGSLTERVCIQEQWWRPLVNTGSALTGLRGLYIDLDKPLQNLVPFRIELQLATKRGKEKKPKQDKWEEKWK